MTDFTDARIVKCPYCKTSFCEQEGPLCDCLMDAQDIEQEIEQDEDEPLHQYKYRRNIRGYK